MPLQADLETGLVTFTRPSPPPVLHRRELQAALDTLALEANEMLASDAQRTIRTIESLLGLESGHAV